MARKSRREALNFELTPLIDVVFLLLIFFMVSSVFKKDELALLLKLPKAQEGAQKEKLLDKVIIELNGEKLAFNGKELDIADLPSSLENVSKSTVVTLRADGEVKYNRLVKVLDILQQKKIDNISLITEKDE